MVDTNGAAVADRVGALSTAPEVQPTRLTITTIHGLRAALDGHDPTRLTYDIVPAHGVARTSTSLVIVNTDLAAVFPVPIVLAIQDRRARVVSNEDVTSLWGITPDDLLPGRPLDKGELIEQLQRLLGRPRDPRAPGRLGLWDPTKHEVVECEVELVAGTSLRFYVPDDVIGRIQAAYGRSFIERLTTEVPS